MLTKNVRNQQHEESFEHRKLSAQGKPDKTLRTLAQLRAENEALRSQIVSLQGQWDILKSTLGVLSTTVCSHETF